MTVIRKIKLQVALIYIIDTDKFRRVRWNPLKSLMNNKSKP